MIFLSEIGQTQTLESAWPLKTDRRNGRKSPAPGGQALSTCGRRKRFTVTVRAFETCGTGLERRRWAQLRQSTAPQTTPLRWPKSLRATHFSQFAAVRRGRAQGHA